MKPLVMCRFVLAIAIFVSLPFTGFAQATPDNMDISKTVSYLNEKVKRFSDSEEHVRNLKVNIKGELEERAEKKLWYSYNLEDIEKVTIEHHSRQTYRVRLECKVATSSCIKSADRTDITRPHSAFYILTELEAERTQKAFEHLVKLVKENNNYTEPFDALIEAGKVKAPAVEESGRGRGRGRKKSSRGGGKSRKGRRSR